MIKKKDRIISFLASLFLSYRDMDEGYFRTLKEIKQLYNEEVFVDINKVQEIAYCEEIE
jgi:hypothetical protein